MTAALAMAAAQIWAIEAAALRSILEIAARENDVEALEARLGQRLKHTRTVELRDGVAIVPVAGPIFRHANLFSRISGATSTEQLALDLTTAVEDPQVRAILLNVDSPGGMVTGTAEMADMLFRARDRKPIWAYVDGAAASAAYWIAAGASRIVASSTGELGSIGAVLTVLDNREALAQRGVRQVEIVSSQSPRKRPDPLTDAGRADLQARVDAIAEVFVRDVAAYRGVTAEAVLERYGAGGMFVGAAAVAAGLADALGTFEDTLAALAGASKGASTTGRSTRMNDTNAAGAAAPAADPAPSAAPTAPPPVLVATSREQCSPELVALLRGEGALAERQRIADIEALALPGFEGLKAEHIASGASAMEFGRAQKATEQRAAHKVLADLAADGRAAAPPPAASAAGAAGAQDLSALPLDERIKAEWANDPNLRAEFGGNEGAYAAFRRAEASGRAKILRRVA